MTSPLIVPNANDVPLMTAVRLYDAGGNPLLTNVETSLALPTLNTKFIDSAAAPVGQAKKTIYLIVDTTLTWVTSGQATLQAFASRDPYAAQGGASSQLGVTQVKLGSAQNIGASGTSLAAGIYRVSPAAVAELQWPDALIGVELAFPSALTAGVARLFVEAGT